MLLGPKLPMHVLFPIMSIDALIVLNQLTKFDVPGLFESMFTDSNPWYWCKGEQQKFSDLGWARS